jgi:PAS domain-containing protein
MDAMSQSPALLGGPTIRSVCSLAMDVGRDKSLLLILAREMATNLATPMFVVDPSGVLVFYNEAAESVLGQTFAVTGPIGPDQWGGTMFRPEDLDGNPVTVNELPLVETMTKRRPAHAAFRITGLDGVKRTIEATSFPLFARVDELAGAVGVFWEIQK